MSNLRLVAADTDQKYLLGLSEYLLEDYGQIFDVCCFTTRESLITYLSAEKDIDILLLGSEMIINNLPVKSTTMIFNLSDIADREETSKAFTLYRFQSARKLVQSLLEKYEAYCDKPSCLSNKKHATKIVACYSAAGGDGKSTVASNLARLYNMNNKRSLLISTETFGGTGFLTMSEKNHGITYFIHLIKEKLPNLEIKLESIIKHDTGTGIYYIGREQNMLEYKDISKSDMELFLLFLKTQGSYDIVLIDMETAINEASLGVLSSSDIVVQVVAANIVSQRKAEEFEKQISKIEHALNIELCSKLIRVHNKVSALAERDTKKNAVDKKVVDIPYISEGLNSDCSLFSEMRFFHELMHAVDVL